MAGNNTDWGVPGNTLTQPPFAGPDDPAIVIFPDPIPPSVIATIQARFPGAIVAGAQLWRKDGSNYWFDADFFTANVYGIARGVIGTSNQLVTINYWDSSVVPAFAQSVLRGGDIAELQVTRGINAGIIDATIAGITGLAANLRLSTNQAANTRALGVLADAITWFVPDTNTAGSATGYSITGIAGPIIRQTSVGPFVATTVTDTITIPVQANRTYIPFGYVHYESATANNDAIINIRATGAGGIQQRTGNCTKANNTYGTLMATAYVPGGNATITFDITMQSATANTILSFGTTVYRNFIGVLILS